MGWGILAVSFLGVIIAFVILQETFVQRHWRGLVDHGDTWAIRTLVEQEIERWRELRVPKGVDAALWHGVQSAEVASVGKDFINLICSAEGEYRVVQGRRQEVSSPLDEGMKLAAALLERLFYDIPNVRLATVRVDVYTTFRGTDGAQEQQCILTTLAERADAERLPWEELLPREVMARFETRFQLGANGAATPIDPGPVLSEQQEGAEQHLLEAADSVAPEQSPAPLGSSVGLSGPRRPPPDPAPTLGER